MDSNGNIQGDGDSVTVIKGLEVKGSSTTLEAGTRIRKIRFIDGDRMIDCKVDGMRGMLKVRFLKRA